MDKKYVELFKELAHATEVSAEQVMEYDKSKNDSTAYDAAVTMREDFSRLYDALRAEDYDGTFTRAYAAKLLVACYVTVGQLQDRINNFKKAIAGYQTDLIPKLNEVLNAASDEEAQQIADEKFSIKSEEVNT